MGVTSDRPTCSVILREDDKTGGLIILIQDLRFSQRCLLTNHEDGRKSIIRKVGLYLKLQKKVVSHSLSTEFVKASN